MNRRISRCCSELPCNYLLDRAGYQPQQTTRLIMGGPMMGFTVPDATVPIVKTTNCLLAPSQKELPTPPPAQACIRCGMCAEACPASLLPQQMFWFAQGKEFEKLEQHNLFDCIECGACSYACPSNIPLVQYYRASKAEILQLRRDQEKSEHSRIRFEARQQRLEQEAAEKEAKRAARKLAAEQRAQQAAGSDGEEDPIQAAIERAKAKKAAQQTGDSDVSELEKLEKTVVSTRKRLDTATTNCSRRRPRAATWSTALQTGVDKTRAKLAVAEKALQDYQQANNTEPASQTSHRCRPGRHCKSDGCPRRGCEPEPRRQSAAQLEKLQQRLEKSQAKLAQSRENGDEEKIIEALEATVVRLTDKISEARSR